MEIPRKLGEYPVPPQAQGLRHAFRACVSEPRADANARPVAPCGLMVAAFLSPCFFLPP